MEFTKIRVRDGYLKENQKKHTKINNFPGKEKRKKKKEKEKRKKKKKKKRKEKRKKKKEKRREKGQVSYLSKK